ncbi:MAG: hypothetical protein C4555_03110 [Dehalococcoidia bacterium]|nr:MAG: hypothetical protein C4555_03110 [Dehalococcoidia bacterium]
MPQFITENNIPNAKVIALTIAGGLVAAYLAIAPIFGLPMFDKVWMMQNIETILSGGAAILTAFLAIVAYFKKPSAGDGIKPKE